MNCTRVLHAFSHPQSAVTPVDLAKCLGLSQHQPLYQLLSIPPFKPTQHCSLPKDYYRRATLPSTQLSSSSSSLPLSRVPSKLRSCFRRTSSGLSKKRVVFADARGLALTAVHLFTPEPSSFTAAPLKGNTPAQLEGQQSALHKMLRHKLQLGFPPPSLDVKSFLAHLRESNVLLESCSVLEHNLTGKVCVSHMSTKQTVHIRVTFDSWRSHHDIPCMFLQHQNCGGLEVDVFSFDISLPPNTDPKERTEFCICLRPGPGSTPYWDDNRGQNYRVCMEKGGSSASQGNTSHCYPTLSKLQPHAWPHTSACVQNTADLQYLQRYLSSRCREWKDLCSAK
ncbi:protein phosphatase 1 regulatory subunit 3C-B [Melanotaenia boesemani]|uniref:protein phosphatase 1 regulatory subunit 3C-B n=1 Tax=Melanotaenia boesemani TaxID=1250792 RepID=UPI001C0440D0|nr:protein phosphatase 1 regulatory subunit 3C-B [Melanotaenia boesemani]